MWSNRLKQPTRKGNANLMPVFGTGLARSKIQVLSLSVISESSRCFSPPWSQEDLIMERCPRTSRAGRQTWAITDWRMQHNKQHSRWHISKTFKILILPQGERSGRPQFGCTGKSNLQGRQRCFCNYCRTRTQPPDLPSTNSSECLRGFHWRIRVLASETTANCMEDHCKAVQNILRHNLEKWHQQQELENVLASMSSAQRGNTE